MKCSLRLLAFRSGSAFVFVLLSFLQFAVANTEKNVSSGLAFPFSESVFNQTGEGLPKFWGRYNGQLIPAHYSFSTNLLLNAARKSELLQAMRALPSLSVVTDSKNLFSPETGIYLHPTERGKEWERPATVSFFDVSGQKVFEINCGLRIHGGMSRQPEESPKHSFRLAFRREYGSAKLHSPLFGTNGPQEFDELVLRAGSNDSWLNSNGDQRSRATYIRDEWTRRSMKAMGHRSACGMFVHLYLNGLYWGLYNVCERPGPQMLDARGECDVLKGDETESGDRSAWNKILALANSGPSDQRRYEEICRLLDVSQFTDFLLLNLYAANTDWDRSANWYAIRSRKPAGKFQFFVWDAERTLEDPNFNGLAAPDEGSPLDLFQKLLVRATFRAQVAARAQQLFFGDGPLGSQAATKHFRDLADSVAKAMPLEEARWGSYRRDVYRYKSEPYELYTVKNHWQPEVDRVAKEFFSQRREIFLRQMSEAGISSPPK